MISMTALPADATAALVRHRARSLALRCFPGPVPDTLDAAYRIQAAAIAGWNRPVVGWKVGLVSCDLADRFGDARFIGPIFAETVVSAAAADTADFPAIAGGSSLAEAELVARVEPMPRGRHRISRWHIGLEVAGSPVADIGKLGSFASIAAFGNNVGLILGPSVSIADPAQVSCTVEIDGQLAGSDTGARLPGGPAAAVEFAIAKLAELGIASGDGFFISTGAITGMHPVAVGQRIAARFEPGGMICARVVLAT